MASQAEGRAVTKAVRWRIVVREAVSTVACAGRPPPETSGTFGLAGDGPAIIPVPTA